MDQLNPFETTGTFRLHRAEYLVGWLISVALIIVHFGQIRWVPFVALFVYIDAIGYIPGAIAFRRSKTGKISRNYYTAYNIMHSLITQAAVIGLWILIAGPEWALLAIPFHVFGDRGLFGNFLKSYKLPFEPVAQPAYLRLRRDVEGIPIPADDGQHAGHGASHVPGPLRTEGGS